MANFIYDTYIATTPETLWKALTTSEYTEKYFFGTAIQSDWQVGSEIFYLREGQVTDYGKIVEVKPYEILSFTWTYVHDKAKDRKEPSIVTFTLTPKNGCVKLSLIHEKLLPSDFVYEENTFQGLNNGWPAILSNLKSLLETGKTLPEVSI